jgi:hypothetical protein
MPRETLEPLPLESSELIGISADRCYCLPDGAICAPCQEREPELMDELEPMELEDRLAVALDNEFARQVVAASENRLDESFEVQVEAQTRKVTLRIQDTENT